MKISIVMPSFNGGVFLEEAIQSVLSQECKSEIEFIVMDGGSTDNTLSILKKYDHRIIWYSEKDKGHQDALNKGFKIATGDIAGWLNVDDYFAPGAFAIVEKTFEANRDAIWVAGYCRLVDENGKEIRRLHSAYKHFLMHHYSYRLLLTQNIFSQPSVFIRMDALRKELPLDYESENRLAFDYELWLKLGKKSKPVIIPYVLSNFRFHKNSITTKHTVKLFRSELNIARKYGKEYPFCIACHWVIFFIIRLVYHRLP